MWRKASSLLTAVAVLADPIHADPCRKVVQQSVVVQSGKVLVPATISGHTNVLVAVPESVAFSQIAVQVGVPVATYSPLAYQPAPQGPGMAPPACPAPAPQPTPSTVQPLSTTACTCPDCQKHSGAVQAADARDSALALEMRVVQTFKESCVSCHSSEAHKGGFRLFDDAGRLLPLPRHMILARVTTDDPAKLMPKGGHKLPEDKLADIAKWATPDKSVQW